MTVVAIIIQKTNQDLIIQIYNMINMINMINMNNMINMINMNIII